MSIKIETRVFTAFGAGVVTGFNALENRYSVKLDNPEKWVCSHTGEPWFFVKDLHVITDNDLTIQVANANPSNQPMIETDFYKWMTEQNKDNFHRINDIHEYLKDRFDFVKGVNTVAGDVLRDLRCVGGHYFDTKCK